MLESREEMLMFSVLTAAIAPGLSLLIYLYLRDRYEAEPIHMVLRLFVFGILIVVPIMVIQRGIELWIGNGYFISAFIQTAGVEEFMKWFVLFHVIYNHTEFDEPYDGILYAAAVSLGFATMENILYAFYTPATFGTLLARALLPVSGHALFGIMMGYYMGKAKFALRGRSRVYLAVSFGLPFLLHGSFDWIIYVTKKDWIWFIIPFMLLLWIWGLRKMRSASALSPFRLMTREEEVKL